MQQLEMHGKLERQPWNALAHSSMAEKTAFNAHKLMAFDKLGVQWQPRCILCAVKIYAITIGHI